MCKKQYLKGYCKYIELVVGGKNMKKKFLLFSFAVPDQEMKREFTNDQRPMVQTHKFIWKIIKGLEQAAPGLTIYISSRPISSYPYSKTIFIKQKSWQELLEDIPVSINEIMYINIGLAKVISRFIFSFILGFSQVLMNFSSLETIMVYSVHIPFMLSGYLLSKIFGKKLVGIWTDPPAQTIIRTSQTGMWLKWGENYIARTLMRRFDGTIVLTKQLAEDFCPNTPYLLLEGIVDENSLRASMKTYSIGDKVEIVYTGSITKKYGLGNIVEAVTSLPMRNIRLSLFGSGEYEQELKNIASKDSRIVYMGQRPNDQILAVQTEADFLIDARSPKEEFTKYSFPSKIMEYMMSGTPVICTLLPGMSNEFVDYLITMPDNNPKTISQTLIKAMKLSIKERELLGKRAKEFISTKDTLSQGRRIHGFLEGMRI